ITMATSIVLSGVVALTLTPVLCAMILKPHGHKARGPLALLLAVIFSPVTLVLKVFDKGVNKITNGYAGVLRGIVTLRLLTMLTISGFAYGIFWVNTKLPSGFVPLEDQGMIYGVLQTPPG